MAIGAILAGVGRAVAGGAARGGAAVAARGGAGAVAKRTAASLAVSGARGGVQSAVGGARGALANATHYTGSEALTGLPQTPGYLPYNFGSMPSGGAGTGFVQYQPRQASYMAGRGFRRPVEGGVGAGVPAKPTPEQPLMTAAAAFPTVTTAPPIVQAVSRPTSPSNVGMLPAGTPRLQPADVRAARASAAGARRVPGAKV
jgi:hypothetical protein